jgi:hypothetical protein
MDFVEDAIICNRIDIVELLFARDIMSLGDIIRCGSDLIPRNQLAILDFATTHLIAATNTDSVFDDSRWYIVDLILKYMSFPRWDAQALRAVVSRDASRCCLGEIGHEGLPDNWASIYFESGFDKKVPIVVHNMEQYTFCRNMSIPLRWDNIAKLIMRVITTSVDDTKRVFREMPPMTPRDAEFIESKKNHKCADILPECRAILMRNVARVSSRYLVDHLGIMLGVSAMVCDITVLHGFSHGAFHRAVKYGCSVEICQFIFETFTGSVWHRDISKDILDICCECHDTRDADDEIAMIARFACAHIDARHVLHISCNAFHDLLEIHPGARQVARDMLIQARQCANFTGSIASNAIGSLPQIVDHGLSLAKVYADPDYIPTRWNPRDDRKCAIHAVLMRDLMLHELVARVYLRSLTYTPYPSTGCSRDAHLVNE